MILKPSGTGGVSAESLWPELEMRGKISRLWIRNTLTETNAEAVA